MHKKIKSSELIIFMSVLSFFLQSQSSSQALTRLTHLVHTAVLKGQLQVLCVFLHRGVSVNQSEVEKYKVSVGRGG